MTVHEISSHNTHVPSDEPLDDDEKLTQFKLDIDKDANVMIDQRDAADEDMRFINVKGGMWEGFLDSDSSGSGLRLKLQIDLVSDFVQSTIGEWNQNRVGVEYKPDDEGTTTEDSDLLNGIYRSDFRQFSGKIATDNAVDEVMTVGYGAMKLATEFDDQQNAGNDNQHIEWRPIYNAYATVYWEQSAQRIDKRDARWCTELKQFTRDSFEHEFPGKDAVSAYTPDSGINQNNRSTTTTTLRSRGMDIVYVATRYEVKKRKEDAFVYNNLATSKVEVYNQDDHELVKDELKADPNRTFVRKRQEVRQIIEKTVFSGADILEPTRRIAGEHIPIIPFYGYRSYVGGAEWYRGLVRNLKDLQRLFNTQMSQLGENAASAGQEIPIFDPMQIDSDDLANKWANKNNLPFILAKALRDLDGKIAHIGPIGYVKPPQLDGSTKELIAIVPQLIQELKGSVDQEAFSSDMSGKAITKLVKRINLKTQPINDNIASSIAWSGTVFQAMAADGIYTTKRIVNTISRDGTESKTQLLANVMDKETQKMVEANDLRGKRFQAYADVGPQYDTLREQTVEDLKGMLEVFAKIPGGEQYVPIITSVLIDNVVGVGLDPIKDFNRQIMLQQGAVKPETPEEEQMLADLQAQAQEPDPNEDLAAAAAEKLRAEGQRDAAGAVKDTAAAGKLTVETEEIRRNADIPREQLQLDRDSMIIQQATRGLPQ